MLPKMVAFTAQKMGYVGTCLMGYVLSDGYKGHNRAMKVPLKEALMTLLDPTQTYQNRLKCNPGAAPGSGGAIPIISDNIVPCIKRF